MNINALNELFIYNPETGLIYWKAKGKGRIKKKEAGTKLYSGYIGICVGKQRMQAHRLAWALFYGKTPQEKKQKRLWYHPEPIQYLQAVLKKNYPAFE